jgi:hypothetical protein
MARMLAESLSSASTLTPTVAPAGVRAWLVLVLLVVASALALPLLAAILRRRLPRSPRDAEPLEPVAFGRSPKSRRSPRHAVSLHRTLMTTGFLAVLSLVVLTGVAALGSLGAAGFQIAIGLALPTLLVALHARQRSLRR